MAVAFPDNASCRDIKNRVRTAGYSKKNKTVDFHKPSTVLKEIERIMSTNSSKSTQEVGTWYKQMDDFKLAEPGELPTPDAIREFTDLIVCLGDDFESVFLGPELNKEDGSGYTHLETGGWNWSKRIRISCNCWTRLYSVVL